MRQKTHSVVTVIHPGPGANSSTRPLSKRLRPVFPTLETVQTCGGGEPRHAGRTRPLTQRQEDQYMARSGRSSRGSRSLRRWAKRRRVGGSEVLRRAIIGQIRAAHDGAEVAERMLAGMPTGRAREEISEVERRGDEQ